MKKLLLLFLYLAPAHLLIAQQAIEISHERQDDKSIDFSYKKNAPGSHFVLIEFSQLENCNSNRIIKKVITNRSGRLFTLKPAFQDKGISFSYKVRWILGNPKPKVNHDIKYLLPYEVGLSKTIIEATNVSEEYFESEAPEDWKSFLFYSEKSDTVLAMRKGTVVIIEDEHSELDKEGVTYTSRRNRIVIEHKDGTMASYKGFSKDKIFVKKGQTVYPHTPLGMTAMINEGRYRLDFSVYHYLPNLLDAKKSTLKNKIHRSKYLNPTFLLDGEYKKIEHRQSYISSINEKVRLQEFSRREKKKYKKKPENFK